MGDNHKNDVTINANYVKRSTTRNTTANQDGNPLRLTVAGLYNTTFHTNDIRVTVNFTDKFNTAAQAPTGNRIFEVYGHNIDYPGRYAGQHHERR
mgnify:CR=1 FL=1